MVTGIVIGYGEILEFGGYIRRHIGQFKVRTGVIGQVTNDCKFFADGTPVAGRQFDYTFDTIGNRTQTLAGGDSAG